jgi:apolipoprotein N-acyltransferase
VLVAAVAGILLAVAFPKTGFAWAAPLGAAALFWTWQGASWKRACALGWFAGWIFFSISFWWWSTTIVSAVGSLAYAAVIIAAAIEALAIGAAGLLAAAAAARSLPAIAPVAAAAAFTAMEWLRSIGVLGVPFALLGYSQADTPLAVLAAYIGTSGVTFAVCLLGAYAADALYRRTWRPLAACVLLVAIATFSAWLGWPARSLPRPTIPVAAIQGNIAQTLKWQPGALSKAVARYTAMTQAVAGKHPRLIVWPETVIAVQGEGLNQDPALIEHFTHLAQTTHASILAGSIDVRDGRFYNALFLFTQNGIAAIYDKHQLVPFAEHFPGQRFLGWLPYISELNGHFSEGHGIDVYPTDTGLKIGPLICWESAFGDLAYDEVSHGAQLLVIATDDAWFGTTSGPYQHAQIAQLRAVESGEYVIRAAATGISGIIAPNGRWTVRAGLDRQATVFGYVGPPVGSVFAHIGPTRVWFGVVLIYLAVLLIPRVRRAA